MTTKKLTINGMSCNHCVMHVRKGLESISSVKDVQIGSAVVEVDDTKTTVDDLKKAVAMAGYEVTQIS